MLEHRQRIGRVEAGSGEVAAPLVVEERGGGVVLFRQQVAEVLVDVLGVHRVVGEGRGAQDRVE